VRSRPERTPRLDDHRNRVGRRLLPGRADPQRPDAHGTMELAPALLPAGRHRLGRDRAELVPEPLFADRIRVDGERAGRRLLEAFGMEVEQPGPRFLEPIGRDRDLDAAKLPLGQRNALFSFSKNPSSAR
jgi:hypothetical protein